MPKYRVQIDAYFERDEEAESPEQAMEKVRTCLRSVDFCATMRRETFEKKEAPAFAEELDAEVTGVLKL